VKKERFEMRINLILTAALITIGLSVSAAYAGSKGGGSGGGSGPDCCDAGTKPDQPTPTTHDNPGRPDNPSRPTATVTGGGGGIVAKRNCPTCNQVRIVRTYHAVIADCPSICKVYSNGEHHCFAIK